MPDYTKIHLERVSSTNEYALQHMDSLPDRYIVVADVQTQGKGRLGRPWFSSVPENIYASLVLKPESCPGGNLPLTGLSLYLSLCVCEVMDLYGITTALKWPNDILADDKKIGGILGQAGFLGDRLIGIVLGAGINLNMQKENLGLIDQPAISLNLLTGFPVDPGLFLERLADRFFADYDDFLVNGFALIRKEYLSRCPLVGTSIRVLLPDREIIGWAEGFTDNGFLVVKDESGLKQVVTAGDVQLAWDID